MQIVKRQVGNPSCQTSLGAAPDTRLAKRFQALRCLLALLVGASLMPLLQACGQKGGLTLPAARQAASAASASAIAAASGPAR